MLSANYGFCQHEEKFDYEFALIEAARQKTIGNINESIKLYQKCLEAFPESDVAYYELGSIYAALNQAEISGRLLERAHELSPDNYWYILAYSQILDFQQEYRKLIKVLKKYLKENDKSMMWFSLANTYHKLGKNRRAFRILDRMENEQGLSEKVLLKKVEIYKAENKYQKGEKELKKLLEVFPESPEYNIIMAEFLEETGMDEKSVVYFRKAYELDTTNLYAISNLADYYTTNNNMKEGLYFLNRAFTLDEIEIEKKLNTLVYFLGEKHTIEKFTSEFIDIMNTLLSKYPDNYEVKTIAFDFFSNIEHYSKSYEIIHNLLDEHEDKYIFWERAIYIASLLNKYGEIIDLGEKALAIFPNKRELKLFIGIAYYQKENYEECYRYLSESYEPGLEMQQELQYLTFLAESAYKLNKIDESFYYFEELLLLQPDNYAVMNNYSYYMALEDITLRRAEELSRQTIEQNPDNSTYLDTYAWILFKLDNYSEALEYIQKAMKREIEDAEVFFHYAWILCKTGDKSESRKYFERARSAGYNDELELEEGIKFCAE